MAMSDEQLIALLMRNKDKNFINRALNPDIFPVIRDKENKSQGPRSVSTHSMADAEVDGKYISFPTVVQYEGGAIKRLPMEKAIDHAIKTNEFLEFPSQEEATWFSKNYKNIWKKKE